MFYIALSFLVGILWIHFKVISTALSIVILILYVIKKLKYPHLLLIINAPFLPNMLINHYNKDSYNQIINIKTHPYINHFLTFKSFEHKSQVYTGIISYKTNEYRFIYKSLKQNLTHYSCVVKGRFDFDKDKPTLIISTIKYKSCQLNNSFNPIYKHQLYIYQIINSSGVKYPEKNNCINNWKYFFN